MEASLDSTGSSVPETYGQTWLAGQSVRDYLTVEKGKFEHTYEFSFFVVTGEVRS